MKRVTGKKDDSPINMHIANVKFKLAVTAALKNRPTSAVFFIKIKFFIAEL